MDAPHEWLAVRVGDRDIEQHDIDGMTFQRVEHRLAIGDHDSVVARLLKDRGDDARAHDVPVRDEDPSAAQVEDRCGLAHACGVPLARGVRIPAFGEGVTVEGA